MGLKTGFMDSGNFTATLLGFAFFSAMRGKREPYSALENNITQSVAVVAGSMAVTGTHVTAVPAMALLGHPASAGPLILWVAVLGTVGVLFAESLRRRLIVEANLPFPTGVATAELI